MSGIPTDFNSGNYLYPLDVSDPQFVSLAEIGGYPVVGYKNIGLGKIVYIGIEYYYEEEEATHLLQNALSWLGNESQGVASSAGQTPLLDATARLKKRSEEHLYTGSAVSRSENNQTPAFDLKIYPNPYMEKATLDIEMNKASQVSVDMTDESGRVVAVLLPRRQLNAGVYRIELPNLAAGIYFVQCQTGEKTTVKKVVKTSSR
jgi:5-hydroxyisourate hydrolase-like protein (transthyretin family)